MFTSVFDQTAILSYQAGLLSMGCALLFGILAAYVYMKHAERYSKGFIVTLALLPILVQTVILMTSGSLGSAVAVLGTFSLIRFRSAPGTSKEILGIFFAMAIGLACGMGQIVFAGAVTVIVSVAFTILMRTSFGGRENEEKHLRITIPEELDYRDIFQDIFAQYTNHTRLNKVRTIGMGSMYELDYSIRLKAEADEKQMLDEIRVRNGNLSIVCGRRAEGVAEL